MAESGRSDIVVEIWLSINKWVELTEVTMSSLGAFELELAIEPSQVPAGIMVKRN